MLDPTPDATTDDALVIRRLRPSDMLALVVLDARITGRRRTRFFQAKLDIALAHAGIEVSLAAERDGMFLGFLIAQVYYGEFGVVEPVAVLDTIEVHPEFRGTGVGRALLAQLRKNLEALHIDKIRTEVDWHDQALMTFLHDAGFAPSTRICLELDVDPAS